MGCFRIFSENYIDFDILANATESSEQAAFPKENAFNFNRRSKVWRTNGYWNVTASNNTITFRETIAVDLVATIAVAEYVSTASFLTAVKTALEAAGASTYTVTTNSELKIVITSNGAGGGGIFEPRWSASTADTMMGFPNTDQSGALSYEADVLRLHTSEFMLFDMGISSNPKGFALIGSRNDSIKISPTAVIKLQGNETNNFTSPTYDATIPYDDEVLILMDEDGLATEALRYWRVYFEDKDNPNGYVEVGAFFLGDWYSPDRGAPQFPFSSTMLDNSVTVFAESQVSFSDLKPQTQTFTVDLFPLNKEEVQGFHELFNDLGTGKPFFIAYDPSSYFHTSLNRAVKYVKFTGEPTWSLERPNIFRVSLNFREEL